MEFKKDHYLNILSILYGTTPKNAITSKQISKLSGLNESDNSGWPITRMLILETMESLRIPIGACRNGYFIIRNKAEHDKYLSDLDQRISGFHRRIKAVKETFKNPNPEYRIIKRRVK